MKIKFEEWLEKVDIPTISRKLFMESIVCYKVSAYRSAFIMSYIAFQNVLKERIINASCPPTGINPTNWSGIISRVANEDTWDAEISDCVKRSSPNKIFSIPTSTAAEYEAFRVMRNRCAHGKTGNVEYYHIDNFWNYIQENYYKFIINGGKNGIIQLVENHYNPSVTPPNTDVSYIIEHIINGVLDEELSSLINELYVLGNDSDTEWRCLFKENKTIGLWDKLFNESNERIHNAIVDFMKTQPMTCVTSFVERYPSSAKELLSDVAYARTIWKEKIFENYFDPGAWILLENIVNEKLIPMEEKEEFDKALFKKMGYSYRNDKIELLSKTTYFVKLRNSLLDSSNYSSYEGGIQFANFHHYQFVKYVNDFGLDQDSVRCINAIFSFATFGQFYDSICQLMKKEGMIERYKEIVSENALTDYSDKFIEE